MADTESHACVLSTEKTLRRDTQASNQKMQMCSGQASLPRRNGYILTTTCHSRLPLPYQKAAKIIIKSLLCLHEWGLPVENPERVAQNHLLPFNFPLCALTMRTEFCSALWGSGAAFAHQGREKVNQEKQARLGLCLKKSGHRCFVAGAL